MLEVNVKKHLYVETYQKLYKYIEKMELGDGDKLPSEVYLAEKLGVSRMTLRNAMNLMVDDGRIRRVRGSGNYVVKQERYNRNGLERAGNPIHMFSHQPVTKIDFDYQLEGSNEFTQDIFHYTEQTNIIVANRWYLSGEKVIGYCFSEMDVSFIKIKGIDPDNNDQLFEFIEKGIYEGCLKTQTDIQISETNNFVSKIHTFNKKPLLLLSESVYFLHSTYPVLFNKFYLKSNNFGFFLNSQNKKDSIKS